MSPALATTATDLGAAPKRYVTDRLAVNRLKLALLRQIQTDLPAVSVRTLEDQAEAYRSYRADFNRCVEACLSFLAAYAEQVRSLGNDDADADRRGLRELLNDWCADEFFHADAWADEIESGEWEA